ncbi:MAG TPA: toll/interleukin-1 receptor domain-containing protein [Chthoniobacterales bacterium]
MPRDVFISHSAQDKKVSETICAALEQSGIRCWVAPRDVRPGKSFPGEITRAIEQTKVMLLIFSRHSNSSEQVLREVQLAVDCHVPIIRLRLEDIPLSDDLRYYLSTPHWLDALSPPISKHIPPVARAIKELLEQSTETVPGATETPPAAAAMKQPAPAGEEKSPAKWKPFVIGVVVLAAAVLLALWAMRSPKKTEVVSATPIPQLTAQPSATVTLASPTPSPSPTPTPIEVTPTPEVKPSPSPTGSNKKAPGPRNNRAWQVWIDDFVHNFIASNETNDVDLAISFYADNVDVFEEGRKSTDAIRQDIESYNARWPSRRATIRGDVRLGEKTPNHSYTASFEHTYYVENAARGEWINGAVAVDLQITVDDKGIPRIVSMKQKTLRKDKGTMQPKAPSQTDQTASSTPISAAIAPAPSTEPMDTDKADPRLIKVRNTQYGFSVLVPSTVFPNPPTTFTTDRQAFTSADGRAILTLYVERNGSARRLRESYERWSAERTKTEPNKIVDYKVLRDNWFVVSGQKADRGFYLKAVAKKDVLEFMYLDCDENHYPVTGETLTAMSRSFDGN